MAKRDSFCRYISFAGLNLEVVGEIRRDLRERFDADAQGLSEPVSFRPGVPCFQRGIGRVLRLTRQRGVQVLEGSLCLSGPPRSGAGTGQIWCV